MAEFIRYRRSQIAELRPYQPGEPMDGVSVSATVAAQYFADNFEPIA